MHFSTLRSYFRHNLGPDLAAGVTGATAGAPQAMAFAIVAGISPAYGLYTAIISTIIAGLAGSSTYMTTGPTNALAVVLGSTLAAFGDSGDVTSRLVTLTLLVGVIQAVMGLLRFGGLTRYVSRAVMTGFVTGAALLVLMGQLGHLTGIHTTRQSNAVGQITDLLHHLDQLHWPSFAVGLVTIVMIVLLHQTRLVYFATLIAITITGLAIALLGGDTQGVELVRDLAPIPNSLPGLTLPDPALVPELAAAALALAVLGLVQTAALSQSIDEPGGRTPDASREFVGQGAANLTGAFFQSMPAGGSLSRTAINIKSGAHTRWANVFAGAFVALIMFAFSGLAERIALASLAGHLVVAAATLIKPANIRFVWRASWTGRWAMVATFVSTMILPLQYSVYVGVVLSLLLYVHQSSHLRVVQFEPAGDGHFREAPVPGRLPDDEPVILSVQGPLYFAAIRDLEEQLPTLATAQHPVLILRLRGDEMLAGTGAGVLASCADQLRARGGKLILCGVEEQVYRTLARTHMLDTIGHENVFRAHDVLLESTQEALDYARAWLDENCDGSDCSRAVR